MRDYLKNSRRRASDSSPPKFQNSTLGPKGPKFRIEILDGEFSDKKLKLTLTYVNDPPLKCYRIYSGGMGGGKNQTLCLVD